MRRRMRGTRTAGTASKLMLALWLGLVLAVAAWLPLGPFGHAIPTASAHALLVRSEPSADQILSATPSQVRMWFDEDLNPLTSRAVVVDTTNAEVDRKDSHVNDDNPREMDVSLQLLPAGTYVVAWRTQSAVDGHVVGGSFIFRVARPDGSVPPIPAQLPTGHVPGAGGAGASPNAPLDGPTIAQAIFTWLALLFMTFWVGGTIWQTWILTPRLAGDRDLAAAAQAAARRFQQGAPYALMLVILADFGLVLGLSAELAGGWSGAVSLPLLRAVLFGSRFGDFWWMRQLVTAVALLLTLLARRRGWPAWRTAGGTSPAADERDDTDTVPSWRAELVATLRGVLRLPGRIVRGWRGRSWVGRGECVLGAALLVAFALSGHAAAVDPSKLAYALAVDLLHLVGNAAWIGGLLYISVVFVPSLRDLAARQRARVLALGLPQFGALALVSATMLAATGTLNTTIHLTSITQFVTTSYGRTLAVKIEFFLVMVVISAYHAFRLRPRLAYALESDQAPGAIGTASPREAQATLARVGGASAHVADAQAARGEMLGGNGAPPHADRPLSAPAQRLVDGLEDWLRREAMIGVVILFCVALLAAFAGSLMPTSAASTAPATTSPSSQFVQTDHASGYAITLKIVPATFGTNTFTVTVTDAQGRPVNGASVLVQTTMLDMDMGVQNVQLKAAGAASPGTYSGQSDLTMAGHWDVLVKMLPPGGSQFTQADFRLTATY